MDSTKILTREEIQSVLRDLHRRAKGSINSWQNLVVFRLSCCCGLRAMEICGLDVADVLVSGPRPCIRVRKAVTKGQAAKKRGRIVPLWWDRGTLEDLAEWREARIMEAGEDAPFLCTRSYAARGNRLIPPMAAKRWRTAIRRLGPERKKQISIHCGRHSFCSHALAMGRSLVEVKDAAGHRNIATTSIYLHYIGREDVPDLFGDEEC